MPGARIDQLSGGRVDVPRRRPTGAAGRVSTGVDATVGRFTSSLSLGGTLWNCMPTAVLRFATWHTGTRTLTEWDPTTFSSLETLPNGVMATIPNGITVTATYATDGDALTWSIVVQNSGSLAVNWVEWPRLRIVAPSDSTYLTIPIWSGFVKKAPHLDATDRLLSSPSMLGFMGLYDATSKRQLYVEKRDDVGYIADFHFQGDGSQSTTIAVRHFCGPNKTAGNDWTQPYEIRTKTLTTKGDGRSGYVDAAMEYRSWALAQSSGTYLRPWVPAEKWWNRSDYSSRVANAKLFIAHQDGLVGDTTNPPSWSTYLTDLQRTKAFLGASGSDILNVIYQWHGNVFDVNTPAHTPSRSGWASHIASVVAEGAHPLPYVNIPYWDLDLTSGVYNVTNFSTFGDVRAYLSKDDLQAVQFDGGNVAVLDPSFAIVPAIWVDLLGRYYVDAPTAPRGFYFDQIGGTTSSLTFNYSNALVSNGNSGAWSTGKRTGVVDLMTAAKFLNADACGITEQLDEATLSMEATLAAQNTNFAFGLGTMCGTGGIVYGQFQRRIDLTVQISDPTAPGQALAYAQQIIAHWLDGGILGYHNGAVGMAVPALNNADASQAALYYTFIVMKTLFEAHARALPAFKGVQQRPLLGSWQYLAIDHEVSLAEYVSGTQLTHPTSVWQTDDGALWVVLVNHNTTDPYRLRFRVDDYGLAEGTSRILHRDTGSGFAAVGTFTSEVDYYDVPPTGVTLYKLV